VQSTEALGTELTLVAAITTVGLFVLDRRATATASTEPISKALGLITPTTVVSILLLVSGILLVLGIHDGLYVLVVPVIVALTGGVTSAWLLLTKITEPPKPRQGQP
jgi:hypothetical protein